MEMSPGPLQAVRESWEIEGSRQGAWRAAARERTRRPCGRSGRSGGVWL